MVSVLQFIIVKEDFVISGVISQMVRIIDRLIEKPSEFTQEEVESLAAPLLNMVQRLTYEVTEIALDQPGVNLEFKS